MIGRDARVRLALARQHPAARDLPRLVRQRAPRSSRAARCASTARTRRARPPDRRTGSPAATRASAAPRRAPCSPPCRRRDSGTARAGPSCGSSPSAGAVERPLLRARASRDAEAQIRRRRIRRERTEEHAAHDVLPRRRIAVDVRGIRRAVERADLVLDPRPGQIAVELHADVTVRHEARRQAALDEPHVGRRLQPLEADRRLELSEAQVERRVRLRLGVRVVQHDLATAEVRHQPQAEVLVRRGLQDRPHAAQQEGARARRHRPVRAEESRVGLHVAAQPEAERVVRRADAEPVARRRDDGRGRRGRLVLRSAFSSVAIRSSRSLIRASASVLADCCVTLDAGVRRPSWSRRRALRSSPAPARRRLRARAREHGRAEREGERGET